MVNKGTGRRPGTPTGNGSDPDEKPLPQEWLLLLTSDPEGSLVLYDPVMNHSTICGSDSQARNSSTASGKRGADLSYACFAKVANAGFIAFRECSADGSVFSFTKPKSVTNIVTSAPVTAVAVEPLGIYCITGTATGSLLVYDLTSGSLLRAMHAAHVSRVRKLCMSPDGELLASVAGNTQASIWRVSSLVSGGVKPMFGLSHYHEITDVAFSLHQIYTTSIDCSLRVWDRDFGHCSFQVHFPSPVTSLALTASEIICFLGCDSGDIYQLDLFEKKRLALTGLDERAAVAVGNDVVTFQAHGARVQNLRLISNATSLVAGYQDGTVLLWELKSQTVVRKLQLHHPVMDIQSAVRWPAPAGLTKQLRQKMDQLPLKGLGRRVTGPADCISYVKSLEEPARDSAPERVDMGIRFYAKKITALEEQLMRRETQLQDEIKLSNTLKNFIGIGGPKFHPGAGRHIIDLSRDNFEVGRSSEWGNAAGVHVIEDTGGGVLSERYDRSTTGSYPQSRRDNDVVVVEESQDFLPFDTTRIGAGDRPERMLSEDIDLPPQLAPSGRYVRVEAEELRVPDVEDPRRTSISPVPSWMSAAESGGESLETDLNPKVGPQEAPSNPECTGSQKTPQIPPRKRDRGRGSASKATRLKRLREADSSYAEQVARRSGWSVSDGADS